MSARKMLSMFLGLLIAGLVTTGCQGEADSATYRPLGIPTDVAFSGGRTSWRGLVVGQATREEVMTILGKPEKTWSSGDLEVWRYLPAGFKRDLYDFHLYFRLFFRQGILQVVTVPIWGVYYYELRLGLGSPERYIEHKTQNDVAVFASRGITAAVYKSSMSSYVDYLQYYMPMSVEEYMNTWGRFHPEEMPWPSQVPERVDALGFVPGQTRRSDVEAALGPPDFEWAESRASTEVIYYRAPGREPDDLHRFDFRDDVLVWMLVEIWQEDYTTIFAL